MGNKFSSDEMTELLENNFRLHKLVDGYEATLEKFMMDYVETKKKLGELQTKVDELTSENEKLKKMNDVLVKKVNDRSKEYDKSKENEKYEFDCVNAFKLIQQTVDEIIDITCNDLVPFNCVPIGAVFYTKGNAGPFIKIANATDEPLHAQLPDCIQIDNQHYTVFSGRMLCRIKKRREDY